MKDEKVKDVVCGMIKPKSEMEYNSDYGGKTYYFCSQVDKDLFDANPNRWVKESGDKA